MGHEAELVDLPVEAQGIYRQVLHMHKDAKNTNTRVMPGDVWGSVAPGYVRIAFENGHLRLIYFENRVILQFTNCSFTRG